MLFSTELCSRVLYIMQVNIVKCSDFFFFFNKSHYEKFVGYLKTGKKLSSSLKGAISMCQVSAPKKKKKNKYKNTFKKPKQNVSLCYIEPRC